MQIVLLLIMNISDMRREIAPFKYEYLLIVDDTEKWCSVSKLEESEYAVITRKSISLRLCKLFSGFDTKNFKTVFDCINVPAKPRNKVSQFEAIDTSEAMDLMNQSLRKRK